MNRVIEEMSVDDYADAYALWAETPGIGLSASDSPSSIAEFLQRNPGLSFVARESGRLLGTILCGHDGRRGYIHHLVVASSERRQGVGRRLVDRCLSSLANRGIIKCHLFVYADNKAGIAFWRRTGWTERIELAMMSKMTSEP